ncbi:hypothetical protein KDL45_15950, partial [bacterium]|nr:hypothetical protein [bacterium]
MADDLNRTLLAEIRNLTRDIEALEYQIAEKKKSLELLTEVQEKIKSHTSTTGGKRRSKQPISDMIVSVLKGRKKPTAPKV